MKLIQDNLSGSVDSVINELILLIDSGMPTSDIYIDFIPNPKLVRINSDFSFNYLDMEKNTLSTYASKEDTIEALSTLNPSKIEVRGRQLELSGIVGFSYVESLGCFNLTTATSAYNATQNKEKDLGSTYLNYVDLWIQNKNFQAKKVTSNLSKKPQNYSSYEYQAFLKGYIPLLFIETNYDPNQLAETDFYNALLETMHSTPLANGKLKLQTFKANNEFACAETFQTIWVSRWSAYQFLKINPSLATINVKDIKTRTVLLHLLAYMNYLNRDRLSKADAEMLSHFYEAQSTGHTQRPVTVVDEIKRVLVEFVDAQ